MSDAVHPAAGPAAPSIRKPVRGSTEVRAEPLSSHRPHSTMTASVARAPLPPPPVARTCRAGLDRRYAARTSGCLRHLNRRFVLPDRQPSCAAALHTGRFRLSRAAGTARKAADTHRGPRRRHAFRAGRRIARLRRASSRAALREPDTGSATRRARAHHAGQRPRRADDRALAWPHASTRAMTATARSWSRPASATTTISRSAIAPGCTGITRIRTDARRRRRIAACMASSSSRTTTSARCARHSTCHPARPRFRWCCRTGAPAPATPRHPPT